MTNKHTESHDKISHPDYYTQGIECWQYIASHRMNFFVGNVVKYVTRAGKKCKDTDVEDLKKAAQYLNEYIRLLEKAKDE